MVRSGPGCDKEYAKKKLSTKLKRLPDRHSRTSSQRGGQSTEEFSDLIDRFSCFEMSFPQSSHTFICMTS